MPASQQRIVIVGAGFGGIAAAIELQSHGFRDITILDAGPGVGGTWLYNDYPGAACDVPSQLYSFSFAQRKDWARLCPIQSDILAYIRDVAREHGIDRIVHPNTRVTSCDWDEGDRTWTVSTQAGATYEADAVIVATGQLDQPSIPALPGLEDFAGHSFHSARWDHAYDLRGKRVAVVGTGASAVQFVPEIAEQVAHLDVHQRTANWFMPRVMTPYGPLMRAWIRVPGVQAFRRRFIYHYGESLTMMIRHPRTLGLLGRARSTLFMRRQIKDPDLRRRLWPHYTFGCKRILFSSAFLPALQRPNVSVHTDPIERVSERGIVTAGGVEHEVDCIIWGTGFKTNDFMFPMEIRGAGGRSLREAWADGPHAHLGMTVPGFPSLFVLYGPNTNTSGGSILVYLEAQAAYVRQALAAVRERGAAAIDVRPEVEAASDRDTQQRFAGTAWTRCDSWYRDDRGRIVANWPGYMREYEERTRVLDPGDFTFVPAPDREASLA